MTCPKHGSEFWKTGRRGAGTRQYCSRCISERVTATRKKHRKILLEEAGGKCVLCGFDRYQSALQFHHIDPALKEFGIGGGGQTFALARKRAEVKKCILVCANCHSAIENEGLDIQAAVV